MEEDEKTLRISELEDTNRRLEWRVDHARSQYHMFLTKALPLLDSTSKEEIFIELGRNCAKSLGWAKNYVGKPEGFFEFMRQHSGEEISFSEDKSKIIVTTSDRPCDCPIMNGRCVEGSYCNCSIGWQMETYETILERNVSVEIREASLRNSQRCVFAIELI